MLNLFLINQILKYHYNNVDITTLIDDISLLYGELKYSLTINILEDYYVEHSDSTDLKRFDYLGFIRDIPDSLAKLDFQN